MDYLTAFICLLSAFFVCSKSEGNSLKYTPPLKELNRSGRKYDSGYPYPPKFGDDGGDGDDGDNDDDDDDDYSNTGPSIPPPPPSSKNPNYSNLKGYDYGSKYPQFYKGYPFNTNWKGSQKPKDTTPEDSDDDSDQPQMPPLKMMEMAMMMNAMQKLKDSSKDEGFLSKLMSDSKPILMAAIVPLSILLAAVVPVLINYMMTGASLPVIQTTASNKDGRNMEADSLLEDILQNFEEVARAIDADDCIHKTLCRAAWNNNSTAFGSHIRKAASTVANLVQENWVRDARLKSLVQGIKQGKCDDVCKTSTLSPRF